MFFTKHSEQIYSFVLLHYVIKSKMTEISLQKHAGEVVVGTPKVSISVEWKFHDFFSLRPEKDYLLESQNFQFLDAIWCLHVYPYGQTKYKSKTFMGMYLKKVHPVTTEHTVTWRMGIRINDYTYKSENFEYQFLGDKNSFGSCNLVNRLVLSLYYNLLSSNGCITFFCDLEGTTKENVHAASLKNQMEGVDASTNAEESFPEAGVDNKEVMLLNKSGIEKLVQDLESLFLQQKECDTTIKIKDREFGAHRLILGARSTVFASMYSHDTTERRTGIVEIKDCDPDVFQIFLLYLYSGKLENVNSENVLELFVVADKYDVQQLKAKCFKLMINNLSIDSVCDLLVVALRYNESELLKMATDFFVKNAKKIVVTVKWLNFHKEYPVESNELHIKALEFQNQ